jgi:hypothetical protein
VNHHVYSAEQLRTNRASHFVFGGTADERRHWAEEAAEQFAAEGPLQIVETAAQLPVLLAKSRGVVFVPDLLHLGGEAQAKIFHCLRHQEERAKWVLGVGTAPNDAVSNGGLRPDLWYRLRIAQVDVANPEVHARLQKRAAKKQAAKGKSPPPRTARRPG